MTRKRRLLRVGRMAATGAARRLVAGAAGDAALGAALAAELDRMKGMAMKIGQILSYLDTPIPDDVAAALASLQAGEQGMPWAAVEATLEAELGAPVGDLFDAIEHAPVAAASIGQVHRAWRFGEPVAVKVRYPDVAASFDEDLARLGTLASLASAASVVDGPALVAELGARLQEECDYAREAAWQRAFAAAVDPIPDLSVPAVIDARSSAAVLTTAWAPGARWAAFKTAAAQGARTRAATALARLSWRGLLVWRALHADPHPGNFLVTEHGAVTALDFGCVKAFDPAFSDALRRQLLAVRDGASGFESAVRDAGLVGGRGFDYDAHRAMIAWLLRPYGFADFAFTPAYVAEAQQFGRPTARHTRSMAIPPHWIWLLRTVFGLHAVLGRLGARGDFRAVLDEALTLPEAPLSPELAGAPA
jgi:predicted unusual protein kinase regulating ubiquinone biosynthesis (AarF/ABC1/UbiB family)